MGFGHAKTALLAAGLVLGLASPVLASGEYDRVHADSFGNLVIDSAAGYKRIIVGQGRHAREMARYMRAERPKVVYLDDAETSGVRDFCFRPPVLVKGRGYMYGFDQGIIPLRGGPCR